MMTAKETSGPKKKPGGREKKLPGRKTTYFEVENETLDLE
jgi:hypothetical protein